MRATCPAHLGVLNLITVIILFEEYENIMKHFSIDKIKRSETYYEVF